MSVVNNHFPKCLFDRSRCSRNQCIQLSSNFNERLPNVGRNLKWYVALTVLPCDNLRAQVRFKDKILSSNRLISDLIIMCVLIYQTLIILNMSSTKTGKPLLPLKKILVTTDGSENANRAVEAATFLAKQNGSELLIVHVVSEAVPAQYSPIGIGAPVADYTNYFKTIEQQGKKAARSRQSRRQREEESTRGASYCELSRRPSSP